MGQKTMKFVKKSNVYGRENPGIKFSGQNTPGTDFWDGIFEKRDRFHFLGRFISG